MVIPKVLCPIRSCVFLHLGNAGVIDLLGEAEP